MFVRTTALFTFAVSIPAMALQLRETGRYELNQPASLPPGSRLHNVLRIWLHILANTSFCLVPFAVQSFAYERQIRQRIVKWTCPEFGQNWRQRFRHPLHTSFQELCALRR